MNNGGCAPAGQIRTENTLQTLDQTQRPALGRGLFSGSERAPRKAFRAGAPFYKIIGWAPSAPVLSYLHLILLYDVSRN